MAQVKSKPPSAESADWECITIRRGDNGLEICKSLRDWNQAQPRPFFATDPEEAHRILDPCIDEKKYYGKKAEKKESY